MFYRYDKSAKAIFSNFDLVIKKNDKILIDGASGKGKSTLIKLLTGDLECDKGTIFYKGINIKELSETEIYSYIRKIDQEMYFMNITIKEYMQMSKRDVSNDEIRQACNEVNLWEDLKEIDPEFRKKIGENGSNLSGGQKQKLALARLFLIRDKTLLLDEAFSAIDVKDKIEILNRLFKRYYNNTIICVAHDNEIKAMFNMKINIE